MLLARKNRDIYANEEVLIYQQIHAISQNFIKYIDDHITEVENEPDFLKSIRKELDNNDSREDKTFYKKMMSKELRTKAEAGADPLNLHELFSNMQITTVTGQQGR